MGAAERLSELNALLGAYDDAEDYEEGSQAFASGLAELYPDFVDAEDGVWEHSVFCSAVHDVLAAALADHEEVMASNVTGQSGYVAEPKGGFSATVRCSSPQLRFKGAGHDALGVLDSLPYKPRKLHHQNLAYKLLGMYVTHLAGMGATDSELGRLMAKGKDAAFADVAKIYCKHLRDDDNLGGLA